MSQLLFEIFCEEIPARMQARAEKDLARLMSDSLKSAGLTWNSLEAFSGPRRLGLVIEGLPEKTGDMREERRGPRVDAPPKALEGFMRNARIKNLGQCKIKQGKTGAFYVAVINRPGRSSADVIAEAIPELIKAFPWPKSMKFGQGETAQRWVRPLRSMICLLNGKVVNTEVFGIKSGRTTEGHRVHGSGWFEVSDFADYEAKLRANGVIVRREMRKKRVLESARRVCEEVGLELIDDRCLLEEIAGLVEHPNPILGEMDSGFLDLPPEVVTLTMKTHQKYFAVRDPKTGKLASKFVVLANQDTPDHGKAIALGNARVLSARLSDARHFWDVDCKTGLGAMASQLGKVTFHEKLGTVADKVDRVARLASKLAFAVGADAAMAEKAARLAKADLISRMVHEFPELQGVMGRYYALDAGLDIQIADAIRDHYKPQGPSDNAPTAPISAVVALADKLDTLTSFWRIGEKPTGSKDPFALRRAALGVIRILLDAELRLPLSNYVNKALMGFFADRLKVHLKDEGVKHDVIDSVFALGDDDLVRVTRKARALQAFIDTEDGGALLAGYARAVNILSKEEKKEGKRYDGAPDAEYLAGELDMTERALADALDASVKTASDAVEKEEFGAAMAALARVRAPIDTFFESVVINVEDRAVRRNRLLLLSKIRAAAGEVADLSRLER